MAIHDDFESLRNMVRLCEIRCLTKLGVELYILKLNSLEAEFQRLAKGKNAEDKGGLVDRA